MRTLIKIFQYSSILAGLSLPALLVLIGGKEPKSFSQYYFTDASPVFVGFLFWISFGLMTVKDWSSFIRGACLQSVAFFDCKLHPEIHNFSAVAFFIFSLIHILQDKRYRLIGYLMIAFSPVCALSLYYGELIQVLFISLYHFFYFNKLNRIF